MAPRTASLKDARLLLRLRSLRSVDGEREMLTTVCQITADLALDRSLCSLLPIVHVYSVLAG